MPWISSFYEINVRTYVIVEEKPGVYFFSVDASQTNSRDGGPDGAPPAWVVSAVTSKLSIVAYPAPPR